MNRLLDTMKKKKLSLIVSLPDNSLEFAMAAQRGGADALKVHCNIKHKASGVSFGSLWEEQAKLASILNETKIPVGIVPGADKKPSKEEMQEIINMGFDYFDMYLEHIPEYLDNLSGITRIAAIDSKNTMDKIAEMKERNFEAVEAAIIPNLGYGQNLTIGDLQYYISIAIASSLPVIVPTQRKITVDEVPIIADTGVKALMIGAIVTGKTASQIEAVTREFRLAIDELDG